MKSSINLFLVVLDEPNKDFFPGDQVHGKIVLDVRQEIKLCTLNLECRGEVYVSWPENYGTYTRYRFGKEELFHVKACVYGETEDKTKGQNPSPSVLKPSVYSFCFRYTIPRIDLPPSYEAKHGYIRYWMQANIEKKKGKSELKTAKQVFDISGYAEYDEEELKEMKDCELNVPNEREATMLIGGSCYPTGSLTLSARTNKFLYHPGEVITTHVTTGNDAYRGARIIEASLVRLTEYNDGKSNKTHSKQEVVRVEKEVEDAGEKDLQLVLPTQSLQPTMMRACKCIKVSYYLQVRTKINGKTQKKSVLMIPVVVVPSPVRPSPRPPTLTQSHSDLQKDSPYDSVSNITPGTLFYVTGSPYGNKWDIPAGSLYENEQHRSRRASRESLLDEDSSGSFFFNDQPFISYV